MSRHPGLGEWVLLGVRLLEAGCGAEGSEEGWGRFGRPTAYGVGRCRPHDNVGKYLLWWLL